jgi:hypothetical protein
MRALATAAVITLLAACSSTENNSGGFDAGGGGTDAGPAGFIDPDDGDGIDGDGDGNGTTRPNAACGKMDILFVIDNSGSMQEEQKNLADNFPKFVDVLDNFRAGSAALDYRVAVTTTGVTFTRASPLGGRMQQGPYEDGNLRRVAGMSKGWLERGEPGLRETFATLANVGINGSANEMPLHALRLAVNERVKDGRNRDFLREDALLAVVFLTDEEDCSQDDLNLPAPPAECDVARLNRVTPVTKYADLLDNVKRGRGRWAVAAIAGPGPGRCSSSFGGADEATRLKAFVQEAGKNGVLSSICNADLASALEEAIKTFGEACRNFPPPR